MGAMRHKDPKLCVLGALAQYFFWRWHVSKEEPPSFRRRSDWYRTKLLVGRDKFKELSYPTQLDEIFRAFCEAGIDSVDKTHAMRGCGAKWAELHGLSERQVSHRLLLLIPFTNYLTIYRSVMRDSGSLPPWSAHT
jgi:hypothetical protein